MKSKNLRIWLPVGGIWKANLSLYTRSTLYV
ncbi:Uncharacterised protein [Vibrio cholerae]|nr:Uncharacterised protein [Vibrio cholerae]